MINLRYNLHFWVGRLVEFCVINHRFWTLLVKFGNSYANQIYSVNLAFVFFVCASQKVGKLKVWIVVVTKKKDYYFGVTKNKIFDEFWAKNLTCQSLEATICNDWCVRANFGWTHHNTVLRLPFNFPQHSRLPSLNLPNFGLIQWRQKLPKLSSNLLNLAFLPHFSFNQNFGYFL